MSDFAFGIFIGGIIMITYAVIIDYFTTHRHLVKLQKEGRLETKKGIYTFSKKEVV